jgi:hypothetical protein
VSEATDFAAKTACDILAELKAAKHALLIGNAPKRIRYRSDTGAEQEIDQHKISLTELDRAIAQYTDLCNKELGMTGRRCLVAGL